jgi:hypothetical protein
LRVILGACRLHSRHRHCHPWGRAQPLVGLLGKGRVEVILQNLVVELFIRGDLLAFSDVWIHPLSLVTINSRMDEIKFPISKYWSLAFGPAATMAVGSELAATKGGSEGVTDIRTTRPPLWQHRLAGEDRRKSRPPINFPTSWTAKKTKIIGLIPFSPIVNPHIYHCILSDYKLQICHPGITTT